MPSSRGSSQPKDQTHISYFSCIPGRFLLLSHQGSFCIVYPPGFYCFHVLRVNPQVLDWEDLGIDAGCPKTVQLLLLPSHQLTQMPTKRLYGVLLELAVVN